MTNTEEINKIPDQRIIDLADAILPALESGTYTIKEKAVEIAIFVLQAGYLPSSALVRPLVWKNPDRPISYYDFYAETPIGTIYIKQIHETSWSTWLRDRFQLTGGLTLEEAKQSAQNHFNTLIGSCLQGGGADFELKSCSVCLQMTNHVGEECQKCKVKNQGGGYTETELKKAQLAILCNQKDAAMNENYIIEYLTALKQQ